MCLMVASQDGWTHSAIKTARNYGWVCVYVKNEKSGVIALSIHIRPQRRVGPKLKWLQLL